MYFKHPNKEKWTHYLVPSPKKILFLSIILVPNSQTCTWFFGQHAFTYLYNVICTLLNIFSWLFIWCDSFFFFFFDEWHDSFYPGQDKSWRVRYMVANQLYELCEAVGPEPTRYYFFAEYFNYCISFHHSSMWCNLWAEFTSWDLDFLAYNTAQS